MVVYKHATKFPHFLKLINTNTRMSLLRLASTIRKRVLHVETDSKLKEKVTLENEAKSAVVASYVEEEPSIKQWLLGMRPTKDGTRNYIGSIFPFTTWLPRFNLTWLLGDAIAGKIESLRDPGCLA